MRTRTLLLVLVWAAVAARAEATTRWPLWGDLQPGAYAVGFRDIPSWDESRAWEDETALPRVAYPRPVRVMLWYPAAPGAAAGGTFRQYVSRHWDQRFDDAVGRTLIAHDMGRDRLGGGVEGYFHGDSGRVEALLATPTAGQLDAAPAEGRFPLVVYSLGQNDTAVENVVLWEYLASHGYVVVTVPHLGTNPRRFYLLIHDAASYEAQVRDLEVAMNRVASEPFVDDGAIAVAGHSMGGEYALLLAMRDPRVAALVGLDPSFMSKGAPYKLKIVDESSFDARALRIPLLVQHRHEGEQSTHDVVDALPFAGVTEITYENLMHGDFNSSAEYTRHNPPALLNPEELAARDAVTASRGFEQVCRTALGFLDSVFRTSRFDPAAYQTAGVRTAIQVRDRIDVPTEEQLYGIVTARGLEEAARVLERARAAHPGEPLVDEVALRRIANELTYTNQSAEALEMFRFNALAFPASAAAHADFAAQLEDAKDLAGALVEYRRLLELKPDDADARRKVEELSHRP